ncbi:protein abrupt isoform X2 [Procambarus clarkii]|uniref:protein abrupt isoform X2 n=1 Tax=Procambarus clarkii TaxID=6728 RepID=UPI0037441A75
MGSSSEHHHHHHQQQHHYQQQQQQQHHHHHQQQQDDKKQTYNLCWNEFPTNLLSFFKELREQEEFVDVTLACEGQQVSAHKVVLSACSPYFRSLLKNNPCDHPIIILNEVGYSELITLLQYMYHGEVQIVHDQITEFLRTAKLLQIRGLAEAAAAESRSRSSPECRRENGPAREAATPTPKREPVEPEEESRPPDSPQVKRIKLSSSVGPVPPSSPSPHLSGDPSPPAPTPPIPSLPLSMANMATMAGLPNLPPMGLSGASLPLSLPSSITALPPVTTAHPSSIHHGRSALHTPTPTNHQPSYHGLYPSMASEDTQDTMGSDRSEDRDKSRHDDDDYDHESTLDKMSGLANMAALKGFGGFPGPSGLASLTSAALGSNSDSNPGCTGSRDLDLSVLMSQLGGVDHSAPTQQGSQVSPGSASSSSAGPSTVQLWQHSQQTQQQQQQQEQQQQQQQQQHQQPRPWCEACGRSYSTVGNLKQHVANVHGRGEWVVCGVCGKTFKTRQYLQSHLLQQHGIRQRPTPLLPCPQPLTDPAHPMLPHESPSSSAQTPPFSPAHRSFQNHSSINPSLPQTSGSSSFPNPGQSSEFVTASLNGHAHLPHFGQSSSYPQAPPPNPAHRPAPPQPDSSGQAASPPPQPIKQEGFPGFQTTQIKQEIPNDNYYTI